MTFLALLFTNGQNKFGQGQDAFEAAGLDNEPIEPLEAELLHPLRRALEAAGNDV